MSTNIIELTVCVDVVIHLKKIHNELTKLLKQKTHLFMSEATQLNTSEYKPTIKPSKASNPDTSLSGILSVGDGDLNAVLGAFDCAILPDGELNITRVNSSTDVPSRFAAR